MIIEIEEDLGITQSTVTYAATYNGYENREG